VRQRERGRKIDREIGRGIERESESERGGEKR